MVCGRKKADYGFCTEVLLKAATVTTSMSGEQEQWSPSHQVKETFITCLLLDFLFSVFFPKFHFNGDSQCALIRLSIL